MGNHTKTPWRFDLLSMRIKGSGDVDQRTVIANLSPKMDYSRGMTTQCANANRIVSCVNAMDGIEDPQHYIDEMKRLHESYIRETIELRNENKYLNQQVSQLEATAHHVINYIPELEKPGWRVKVNAILGIAAGGGK